MSNRLKRILSLLLMSALMVSMVSIPSGAFGVPPASPNTWAEINANPASFPGALALEMDEPLYNAIFDTYAHTGAPALDANGDGWISVAEAGAWRNGANTLINLNGRGLTGTIRGIEHFVGATSIIIGSNQLTGEIPANIGNLVNLTAFHLHQNQFSGSIPESFCSLLNLTSFRVDQNQFSGEIPANIGNLANLTTLRFEYNRFSGEIPTSIGNLTNVTSVYFNDNQLTGEIPASIGNLTNVTIVMLQQNLLSGSIPESVGGLSKLIVLYLNNNQLSGSVPDLSGITGPLHLRIHYNFDLVGLGDRKSNMATLTEFETATNPQYDINRTSTNTRYARTNPQDEELMTLNEDFGSGQAILNLTLNNLDRPHHNIDVIGEDRAHLNIVPFPSVMSRFDANGKPILSALDGNTSTSVFNQARAITATDGSGEFIGWCAMDMNITPGQAKANFMVSPDYPYYIVPKPGHEAALAPVAGVNPPNILVPNTTDPFGPNYDANGDGIPDTNIDLMGINPDTPILNVDITGDGTPDLNTGVGGKGNPTQSTDQGGTNYLPPGGSVFPIPGDLINIDVDGDGTPDFNIDTTGDGTADTNIIENGQLSRNIVVSVLAGAGGTATGSGKYDAGATVTLTATPNKGYVFTGWSTTTEGVTFANAKAAKTTFVMPAAVTSITAAFATDPSDSTHLNRPPQAGDTVISGTGVPGTTVVVEVDGTVVTTVVGPDGKWSVTVPPLKAGSTVTITTTDANGVSGSKTYTVAAASGGGDGDGDGDNDGTGSGTGGKELPKAGDAYSVTLFAALAATVVGVIALIASKRRTIRNI